MVKIFYIFEWKFSLWYYTLVNGLNDVKMVKTRLCHNFLKLINGSVMIKNLKTVNDYDKLLLTES